MSTVDDIAVYISAISSLLFIVSEVLGWSGCNANAITQIPFNYCGVRKVIKVQVEDEEPIHTE